MSESTEKMYFVNPWVDGIFMGGFSVLIFIYFLLFPAGSSPYYVPSMAISLAYWLGWVVNWPHFAASTYRLYQDRKYSRQFPITSYALPPIMILCLVFSFLSPQFFAPILVKIFLIWSPYHYSGQTYGITLIYLRRYGFTVSKWQKDSLLIFIYSTFMYVVLKMEDSRLVNVFLSIGYASLPVPTWMPKVALVVIAISACLVLVSFRKVFFTKRGWIAGVPCLAQLCWFVLGMTLFTYQVFIPLFHGMQYLFIAWTMQLHHVSQKKRIPASSIKEFVWKISLKWLFFNILLGALLFSGLPHVFAYFSWSTLIFAQAIFFITIQIHHFFVDGVIWRLKKEGAKSPLFMNVRENWHSAGEG